MKKNLLLLIIVFFTCDLYAQRENNVWMLGCELPNHNSGINFNAGVPDTFTVAREMCFFDTNASICDSSGQLVFYTNGCLINNRNHDSLFNSEGFNPGWLTDNYQPYGMGLPQGCLVIPRPNHYGQYYLFHESGELVQMHNGLTVSQPINLSYSLIDMSLDGGLGGIVQGQKNIQVIHDTLIYGRMTGVKHANGRDWWVVVHGSDNDVYHKMLVTPDTIISYNQSIGSIDNWEVFIPQAVFSPQGDKYVIGLTVDTNQVHKCIIDLYDFDRCNGLFSNQYSIVFPGRFYCASGYSFSPEGRFLYLSSVVDIYQYDLWSANINASRKHVAEWDSFNSPLKTKFLFHQLAPDGKIYISTAEGTNVLHYINEPDQADTLCHVIQNSFFLPAINNLCMPNAPNYALGPVTGSVCDSLTGIEEQFASNNLQLTVYPNPNNGSFVINYVLPQNKDGTFEITNMLGEIIYRQRLPQWSNMQRVNLKKIAAGVYSCTVTAAGKKFTKKLVVIYE